MEARRNEDVEACLAIMEEEDVLVMDESEVVVEECTIEVESSPIHYMPDEVEHTIDVITEEEVEEEETPEAEYENGIDFTEVKIENDESNEEMIPQDLLVASEECVVEIDQDFNNIECVYIKEEEDEEDYFITSESNDQNEIDNVGFERYFCKICDDTEFESNSELRNHMLSHSTNKAMKCSICKKLFGDTKSLAAHMKLGHLKLQTSSYFACPLCDKVFKRKFNLDYHLQQHSKTEEQELSSNEYDTCGEQFPNKYSLNSHMYHYNVPGKEKVTCHICNRRFQKNYLKIHITSHTNNSDYSCSFCEKHLSSKQSLYMHMNSIHANEGCYQCSFCHKRFFWKSYLDRHVTVHTKEKNHHCTECSKSFTRKLALRKHMTTHNGPKSAYFIV